MTFLSVQQQLIANNPGNRRKNVSKIAGASLFKGGIRKILRDNISEIAA